MGEYMYWYRVEYRESWDADNMLHVARQDGV